MSKATFSPEAALAAARGSAEWAGLRYSRETSSYRVVRNEKPERNSVFVDEGAMCEVLVDGHFGYAATADLSAEGLARAFGRATDLARSMSPRKVHQLGLEQRPQAKGRYESPRERGFDEAGLAEITDCLLAGSRAMRQGDLVSTRVGYAAITQTQIDYFSTNGSEARQGFELADVALYANAAEGRDSQTRTWHRTGQFGAEVFDRAVFASEGERAAKEALELLRAEDCPSEAMDLILMPDQMMLQIHESIGHPLELDRILGDERNYAGWSFVQPADFGKLRYGSKLMNVTFDPTVEHEMASYAFDDGGHRATREFLIKDGVLLRGLGALESQKRSGIPGVANFRASSWNRAPIDRMANINLEPGATPLAEMVAGVERGVLMRTNRSWSIDDYRNKFQFGCEHGQLIENGKLTRVVKNPNYRGITVDFWNRLAAVGAPATVGTYGTPNCGKGEPNQIIRVGHSSPACLFRGVEVFGGGK